MEIVFMLDTRSRLDELQFALDQPNPGCGGTQFCTIILATLLATARRDWRIRLCSPVDLDIRAQPPNLSIHIWSRKDECLGSLRSGAIVVAPVAALASCDQRLLRQASGRTIPWIHHPFDTTLARLEIGFPAAVAVGTYQYYSIADAGPTPIHHIQNPFLSAPFNCTETDRIYSGIPQVCVLSTLHEGKAFHETAQAWPIIRDAFPGATLTVIGGLSTYGVGELDTVVPTTPEYAARIKNLIGPGEIECKRVRFLGNLGAEKIPYMHSCNVALLNPTGSSEAFPASPLECMAAGLPVIAGFDYGMTDALRFDPELALLSPGDVVDKLTLLFCSRESYSYHRNLALATAKYFDAQTPAALAKWVDLLSAVVRRVPVNIRPEPVLPLLDPSGTIKKRRKAAFSGRSGLARVIRRVRRLYPGMIRER